MIHQPRKTKEKKTEMLGGKSKGQRLIREGIHRSECQLLLRSHIE